MICRKVVVKCKNGMPLLRRGERVRIGAWVGDCQVSICIPVECSIDASTRVRVSKYYSYSIDEDDENFYITRVDPLNGASALYVYQRDVWSKVSKFYIETLARGEPVSEHLLLIGPPGTGKTVMIEAISGMLGVPVEYVRVTEVRSKFYGESEKNLEKKLEEAIESEPCILGIDDAEFLITSRILTGSYSSGVESTEMALRDILFSYLERIVVEGRRVLVVATTNLSPSAIDEALVRGGRFGEPVFISLPNFNALYRYAKHLVGDEEKARELAYKCVSRGLSIADLKTMVKYMKAGLEPDFRRVSGRGYMRLYSEIVPEIVENRRVREEVERMYDLNRDRASTMYMNAPTNVGVPVLTQILMALKRSGIMITDPQHIDEYVYTLETAKMVAVVPTTLTDQVQIYIRNNTRQPVILVGKNPPAIESYTWFMQIEELVRILGDDPKPVSKSVLSFYRIRYTDQDLKIIERVARSRGVKLVDLLEAVVSCGRVGEEIVGRIMMSS
ncbi:MAG: ATP-binding protein [Desulfurococcaceae archaeon]